jgi:hypothetical protein
MTLIQIYQSREGVHEKFQGVRRSNALIMLGIHIIYKLKMIL